MPEAESPAIQPIYSQQEPNEPIDLGSLQIEFTGSRKESRKIQKRCHPLAGVLSRVEQSR